MFMFNFQNTLFLFYLLLLSNSHLPTFSLFCSEKVQIFFLSMFSFLSLSPFLITFVWWFECDWPP